MRFFTLFQGDHPGLLLPGVLLACVLASGCQSTATDKRAETQAKQRDYNLATMDAEDIKAALYIGLSKEEVLKKWGEPEQRKQSEDNKNTTTWYYTRIVRVTRYQLKEKQDEKTGETIYVEEPVEVPVEHVSRMAVFVDDKLESWRIYPAGLTPDMSRAVPYDVDGTPSP